MTDIVEPSTTEVLFSDDLSIRFPEIVVPDERNGYEGFIVDSDNFVEVAKAVRNEYGYDYLSSVTGVDYPQNDLM